MYQPPYSINIISSGGCNIEFEWSAVGGWGGGGGEGGQYKMEMVLFLK